MAASVKITIEAPQGWGKGWLARQIAEQVSAWKAVGVQIRDADGVVGRVGRRGQRIDVEIVMRQPE